MKTFLILVLALLMTQLSFASTAQVNNIGNVGGGGSTTTSPDITVPNGSITGAATNPAQGFFTVTSGSGLGTTPTQHAGYPFYKDGVQYSVANGNTFHCLQYCYMSSSTANIQLQTFTATATFSPGTAHGSITGGVYEGGADEAYPTVTDNANIWRCDSHIRTWGKGAGASTAVFPGTQVGATQTYAAKCTGFETTP